MTSSSLFISAGDPSGDIATARLVEALKELKPGLSCFGLGGERLKALGQEQLANGDDLAVLGFWEVVKRYSYFRELMHRTIDEITVRRPACILLVDYPGFNLRLAKRIKHLGIPIVYYISPQLWAWGGKRISQLRDLVDLLILILPFEREFYASSGVKSEFVGHYLLEDIPPSLISSPIPNSRRLALLPGSRPQEIERMLKTMCDAAATFCANHNFQAVIAGVKNGFDYGETLAKFRGAPISINYGNSREVIAASDLVLTASGTATLETGIIGRPMVIVYKTGFITYQIARRLVTIDKIGLVNLVLGDRVMPELIQHEAATDKIVRQLERFLSDSEYSSAAVARLRELPSLLGGTGASMRAARQVAKFL